MPIVPLRSGVVFPHTESFLTFSRSKSLTAVEAGFNTNKLICVVSQKNPDVNEPLPTDIYQIGTLCRIERMAKIDGNLHVLVRGLSRVWISGLEKTDPFWLGKINQVPEISESSSQVDALCKHLTAEFKRAVSELGKPVDVMVLMRLMSGVSPAELADQIASVLDISTKEKQLFLEIVLVKERLEKLTDKLAHEVKVLELEKKIETRTQKKFDKNMKETILRERLKTIEKELGGKKENKDISELRLKIKEAKMPPEVQKKAEKELSQLDKMHMYNPQASYIRTYLEWLTDMPWSKKSTNNTNLKTAATTLNSDHYGLEEIKERILEYLAVMKLKSQKKGKEAGQASAGEIGPTILCFIGAPGTGKTSIGRSIAKALGRKFVRVSLGGIRDEAEIRGHRRTYIGALPGRIIQGIKNAGTKNPVFMLDEIDKIGADFRGDPSAALMEVLDPEQNKEFSDHYLEVPFDLSEVMFIATGNILDTMPAALQDRLEVIRFPGYTEDEKLNIARKFLLKKTLEHNGLEKDQLEIPPAILRTMIKRYTREAGVRSLEREMSKVMRKVARKIASRPVAASASAPVKKKFEVSLKQLRQLLGPYEFSETLLEKEDEKGIATGLAWTQAGGDILFIEVVLMPGKGKIFLTGHLGQIMKESCQAAISYIRSRWQELGLKKDFFEKIDIHVHVPEGAVAKDGPSAGCAIATAIVSALTKKPVRREVAMTGEITLRGRVYEVGGIREKVLAAHRAGVKTVILPKDNKKNLDKVSAKVKKDIHFVFADHMDQVLKVALAK